VRDLVEPKMWYHNGRKGTITFVFENNKKINMQIIFLFRIEITHQNVKYNLFFTNTQL